MASYVGEDGLSRLAENLRSYVDGKAVETVSGGDGFSGSTFASLEAWFADGATAPENWKVGDIIPIGRVDGGDEFIVIVDDDPYPVASGEPARFTWMIGHLLLESRVYKETLDGMGWSTSDLRTWLNGEFLESLPTWLQKATKTVQVPRSTIEYKKPVVTNDRLFVPDVSEFSYQSTSSPNSMYPFYEDDSLKVGSFSVHPFSLWNSAKMNNLKYRIRKNPLRGNTGESTQTTMWTSRCFSKSTGSTYSGDEGTYTLFPSAGTLNGFQSGTKSPKEKLAVLACGCF